MELDSPTLDVPDLDLVRPDGEASEEGEFQSVLHKVSQAAAELLQVTRVGAWIRAPGGSSLRRVHLYNRSTGRHGDGGVLERDRFPRYFAALEESGGELAVGEVYGDERTRELADAYARPRGIRAWMDTPIPVEEGFAGILRFEQVGPPRAWSKQEQRVGRALGVLVARAWERLSDRPAAALYEYTGDASEGKDLLALLPAGVVLSDASGVIVRCNEAFAETMGYGSPAELRGEPIDDLYASEHVRRALESRLRNEGRITCHGYEGRTRAGESIWLLENAVLLRSGSRAPRENEYVLSTVLDATEWKKRESELEEQAYRDPLTGLANRRLLWESAEQTLALAERHDREVAVAYIDLSGFKAVNDRYGHDVGDRVLRIAGERLGEGVRDSDLVARIGGDEFAVLFAEVEGESGIREVGQRMLEVLRRPLRVNGFEIEFGADVGVALYPRHGRDADELLKHADTAMYEAKTHPDADLVVYGPERAAASEEAGPRVVREERPRREAGGEAGPPEEPGDARGEERAAGGEAPAPELIGIGEGPAGEPSAAGEATREEEATRDETRPEVTAGDPEPSEITDAELREALASDQLALHYQPVYRLPDCELAGAEGLLRWRHPKRGLLSASEFVPGVRDPDLVRALDQWAVTAAVGQLRRWEPNGSGPWISVNVEPISLEMLAFYLDTLLAQQGADASRLVLEVVTESASSDVAELSETLTYLRRSGCRIALDLGDEVEEVGAYLEAFPADMVKMDLTYLERVSGGDRPEGALRPGTDWPETEMLVKRVETEGQYERARRYSAGLAQGFYCGRPVPAERLASV